MSRKNRLELETEAQLLDAFWDLLSDGAPETEEEVQAFLVERGYNLEELNARAERVLKPALEASPLNWHNKTRQKMDEVKRRWTERSRRRKFTRQENITAIKRVPEHRGTAAGAYFRNSDFDSLSDEEIQDIRDELDFLQANDDDKPSEKE